MYWVTCQQLLSLSQSSVARKECKWDYAVINSKILPPASYCGVWAVSLLQNRQFPSFSTLDQKCGYPDETASNIAEESRKCSMSPTPPKSGTFSYFLHHTRNGIVTRTP